MTECRHYFHCMQDTHHGSILTHKRDVLVDVGRLAASEGPAVSAEEQPRGASPSSRRSRGTTAAGPRASAPLDEGEVSYAHNSDRTPVAANASPGPQSALSALCRRVDPSCLFSLSDQKRNVPRASRRLSGSTHATSYALPAVLGHSDRPGSCPAGVPSIISARCTAFTTYSISPRCQLMC